MPPKYPAPFLSRRSGPRPVSQATEIFDTDFESDYEDDFDYSDESPRRSVSANQKPLPLDKRSLTYAAASERQCNYNIYIPRCPHSGLSYARGLPNEQGWGYRERAKRTSSVPSINGLDGLEVDYGSWPGAC
jgi:hypothetical protein